MVTKRAFVACTNPLTGQWLPIGILSHDGKVFSFCYTNGIKFCDGFYLPGFNDPLETYESDELFPIFTNRILSPSRPEFADVLRWCDLPPDADQLTILTRTGGRRVTDTLEVFPDIDVDPINGVYSSTFFIRRANQIVLNSLDKNKQYKVTIDQNGDNYVRLLRIDGKIIGECPIYISELFNEQTKIEIVKINYDCPVLAFSFLCKVSVSLLKNKPFQHKIFEKYSLEI
jgi:hypothetical protein